LMSIPQHSASCPGVSDAGRPIVKDEDSIQLHGGIYLCQVSATLSCGACCGLYNLPDLSREMLEELLSRRSEDFASVARTDEEIFAYQRRNRAPHRLSRPFPQFHHCPFLGFIGSEGKRVGCLLHPKAPGNNDIDYRSLSWYGELACRTYFCPSTRKLPEIYKAILIENINDWYDFGLIVTEYALVTEYFRELESRLERPITPGDYTGNQSATHSLREFVQLKSRWPYRRDDSPGPCNFFFENGLYPRPEVFRAKDDIPVSRFEQILKELETCLTSVQQLEAAELFLDDLFYRAEQALLPV